MSFDTKWENEIYRKKKQINRYPYDSVVSIVNRIFRNKNMKNTHALDLGCGTGNNSKFLANYGFEKITAIDGSSSAINLAKKTIKSKRCKFICADFNNYDFVKMKFDLIIDRGSLTHNSRKNIKNILLKLKETLKDEGYFISYLFSKNHSEYKNYKLNKSFKKKMNVSRAMTTSFYSKIDLVKLFKHFKIISLNHIIDKNVYNNEVSAFWYLILKNK